MKQDQQIIDIVENFYDIGTVTAVDEILGGYNSRSFGLQTHKDGCARTYFLRKYKDGVSVGEIRFEHALISHAIKNGFTICAGIVANAAGDTYVQPGNSRSMFAIYEYLEGEDKYTWDNPALTDAEFINAGRVLAIFHNAVHDFNPGGLQRSEPPILKLWPLVAEKFAGFVHQKKAEKWQAYYEAQLPGLLDMIARNPLDPIEAEGLPVIPIHCDYHPGNLKWTDERVVGIFDFDWSKVDLRLFDVAMAAIYFCSRWDGDRDGEFRCDKCELFIGAYQQELYRSAGLEPLTPAEKKLLPKMLDIANIYLIHWEVSAYMDEAGADDDEYLTYLKHNIRLMRWLEAHWAAVAKSIAGALS